MVMRCHKSVYGITGMDSVRNQEMRKRTGVAGSKAESVGMVWTCRKNGRRAFNRKKLDLMLEVQDKGEDHE